MGQLQAELGDTMTSGNVIVISPDSPAKNKAVMAKQKLSVPIYSDPDYLASKAYGIVFEINPETKAKFTKYGIDLTALYGRETPLMPTPAVYILNKEGRVAFNYVNPNYSVRLAPKVIAAFLQHGL